MGKKVIELIRVSTEGQAAEDRAGIPAQREINRRTARNYGLDIVRSIEDVHVSGAAILKSPEVQELLPLIECSDFVGVMTYEFSRMIPPLKMTDSFSLQHYLVPITILY